MLSQGVTSAPAVPGLDYAFLELDGEEFVAVGESTMIFTGSGSVPRRPSPRPVILPAARRARRFPTRPRLTAFTSPRNRASR